MNRGLRNKYNISDNPTSTDYGFNDNINNNNNNNNNNKSNKCPNCIFIMYSTYTMLNTFYFGSFLYIYLKYFQDLDDTYEKLRIFLETNHTV